jgi:pimeloyl-ACP methyl ester carboxylesterase
MELFFHDPGRAAEFSQILEDSGFAEEQWERGLSHHVLLPGTYETKLPLLRDITRPSLLLRGEDDMVTTPQMLTQFSESVPGGIVRTFNRSGHFAYLEEAAEYCEVVTDFVLRNSG